VTLASAAVDPTLPTARGPLSMAVINLLTERAPRTRFDRIEAPVADCDPYGIDVQVALYVCYELHYRGFAGVDPGWEWNPGLLHLRARLEDAFRTAIRRDTAGANAPGAGAAGELDRLTAEPAADADPSGYLVSRGTWQQLREYFVHRSLHHLTGGDPHTWALPGLTRQSGTSFAAVESGGLGAGRRAEGRQQLFAGLMVAADLDPGYLSYIDVVPAEALAVVNLMSLFGLHRRHRGATVGHSAAMAVTAPRAANRISAALARVNAPEPCQEFYRGHTATDPVREESARSEVGDLIGRDPALENDVIFGIRAFGVVEDRLAAHLMRCWHNGETSLRRPLCGGG